MSIPAPVKNGFNEWPSIEFPAFLRELRFEDHSYHNDLCARAVRPLEGYSEDLDFPCVYAWVEHEKADDREMAEEPRYNVYLKHDQYDEDDQVQVYAGDDADACRRAILALHGRVLGSSDEGACLGSIAEFGDGSIYVLYDDEEWRDYEERENGAIRYILRDGEWVTPCGVSVATLIDLMEVK